MAKYYSETIAMRDRIARLKDDLFKKMPEIESARARLITESYRMTEGEPMITRRAKAFLHILQNIPIIIRDEELVVGSTTLAPRGCQTYPEFSYEWLEAEFDTVATRSADPFYISEDAKREIAEADRDKFSFGDTAAVLFEKDSRLFIDCAAFAEGYNQVRVLPAGRYFCLQCPPERVKTAERELAAACASSGAPFPAWHLARLRIVGLLKWEYILQAYTGRN